MLKCTIYFYTIDRSDQSLQQYDLGGYYHEKAKHLQSLRFLNKRLAERKKQT